MQKKRPNIHKVEKYIWCIAIVIPIVSFLTDFGILIIHECIPVHALVSGIMVCKVLCEIQNGQFMRSMEKKH